jgi:hypothetical protein
MGIQVGGKIFSNNYTLTLPEKNGCLATMDDVAAAVASSGGGGGGTSTLLTESVTLTHAQLLALTYSTPFTMVDVPADKYAYIVNAVIEKNFTTGYTLNSAFFVIAQANDEFQSGQSIYLSAASQGIQLDVSGQKVSAEVPDPAFRQIFGGDIVFWNGDASALTGGHADNVLKVTVYYTLTDKLV